MCRMTAKEKRAIGRRTPVRSGCGDRYRRLHRSTVSPSRVLCRFHVCLAFFYSTQPSSCSRGLFLVHPCRYASRRAMLLVVLAAPTTTCAFSSSAPVTPPTPSHDPRVHLTSPTHSVFAVADSFTDWREPAPKEVRWLSDSTFCRKISHGAPVGRASKLRILVLPRWGPHGWEHPYGGMCSMGTQDPAVDSSGMRAGVIAHMDPLLLREHPSP